MIKPKRKLMQRTFGSKGGTFGVTFNHSKGLNYKQNKPDRKKLKKDIDTQKIRDATTE